MTRLCLRACLHYEAPWWLTSAVEQQPPDKAPDFMKNLHAFLGEQLSIRCKRPSKCEAMQLTASPPTSAEIDPPPLLPPKRLPPPNSCILKWFEMPAVALDISRLSTLDALQFSLVQRIWIEMHLQPWLYVKKDSANTQQMRTCSAQVLRSSCRWKPSQPSTCALTERLKRARLCFQAAVCRTMFFFVGQIKSALGV